MPISAESQPRISRQDRKKLISSKAQPGASVSLLTGGSDRPYVFGLTTSLISNGVTLDLIGSDELNLPEFRREARIAFLNLRGSSDPRASRTAKIARILGYYTRLIRYAARAKPEVFHILWNNRFETFDRTILMLYYKSLQKKIILTVHNVNMRKRDASDTFLNRLTLRIQYRLCDHLFVHTQKMKTDLINDFGVRDQRITVIPFGVNDSLPNTHLTSIDAKQRLGISANQRVILFFGRITPYKGLDYLISAFQKLSREQNKYCLIIAGRVERCEANWRDIRSKLDEEVRKGNVVIRDSFIPDDEVETYFKAGDVLVLPYRDIYQSGVLFTGQRFGIPVLAADVGSFSEEIIEGRTGFLFQPEDPNDLARAIEQYFESDLYAALPRRREEISANAANHHSWDIVGNITRNLYSTLKKAHSQVRSTKDALGATAPTGTSGPSRTLDEPALTSKTNR